MATFATGFQIGGVLSAALLIYGGYLAFASLFSASKADTRHAPPLSRFRRDGGTVPGTKGGECPGFPGEQIRPNENRSLAKLQHQY